jgi:RNA polymerase sigma-70 factor, ECF subfamily
MSSPADDQYWIARARNGDTSAFSELVMRHQWTIRAFLLARLSRKEEAEDLAQETFVTAWRKLAGFDHSRPFVPWLRGIALNLLRNHLRKFKEAPIGGDEALQALLDQQLDRWDEAAGEGPRMSALAECLTRVDGPARELLTARYVEGHSLQELCARTGRKHSAITMQLHRLRQLLADCVDRKMDALRSEA